MNKKIKIQGLDINYIEKGQGKALVILHGWGGSSKSWENVINLLSNNKYRVICPDLPGFGESDSPKKSWNINEYIRFVLEFLKILEVEDFVLLGHSFGGGLSTKITADYPRLVQKLILCDAAVVRAKERLNLRQKVAKSCSFMTKIFANNEFYKNNVQKKLRPLIYKIAGTNDYYKANETMKETFKKVFAEDLRAYLTYIKKPTLVVWGEKDITTPIEDAYTIKNIIDGAELTIIKEVAHSPHIKKPEELAKIITEFINRKI
ncbi:MAG: alpha/beta hydrolase [Candidatus Pacebacteria bacterium]|nr:alpha/beta hydrolase [Candidatus Paceibacterota bacterium]